MRLTATTKLTLTCIAMAVIGLACVIVPPHLLPNGIQQTHSAPLFQMLRTAWENLAFLPMMILLFLAGLAGGAMQPKFWWLAGLATVIPLPASAVMEMLADPASHNLWPIEFVFYGVTGLAPLAGAFAGSRRPRN